MVLKKPFVSAVPPPLRGAPFLNRLIGQLMREAAVTGGIRVIVFVGKDADDDAEENIGQRENDR